MGSCTTIKQPSLYLLQGQANVFWCPKYGQKRNFLSKMNSSLEFPKSLHEALPSCLKPSCTGAISRKIFYRQKLVNFLPQFQFFLTKISIVLLIVSVPPRGSTVSVWTYRKEFFSVIHGVFPRLFSKVLMLTLFFSGFLIKPTFLFSKTVKFS